MEYHTSDNAICYGTELNFVKNWSCLREPFLFNQHAFKKKLPGKSDKKLNFPYLPSESFLCKSRNMVKNQFKQIHLFCEGTKYFALIRQQFPSS